MGNYPLGECDQFGLVSLCYFSRPVRNFSNIPDSGRTSVTSQNPSNFQSFITHYLNIQQLTCSFNLLNKLFISLIHNGYMTSEQLGCQNQQGGAENFAVKILLSYSIGYCFLLKYTKLHYTIHDINQ